MNSTDQTVVRREQLDDGRVMIHYRVEKRRWALYPAAILHALVMVVAVYAGIQFAVSGVIGIEVAEPVARPFLWAYFVSGGIGMLVHSTDRTTEIRPSPEAYPVTHFGV